MRFYHIYTFFCLLFQESVLFANPELYPKIFAKLTIIYSNTVVILKYNGLKMWDVFINLSPKRNRLKLAFCMSLAS